MLTSNGLRFTSVNWSAINISVTSAGTVAAPVTVGSDTIYYRGRYIMDAFIDKILSMGVGACSDLIHIHSSLQCTQRISLLEKSYSYDV